jgi:methylenetetrahydrofolate dehydrogenase (NADP+)/methenyltetrahydrofolate cyclohydrolase/formyltetrahydrofolate synthetase
MIVTLSETRQFVAIDPHALASDTFAFVKRQKPGLEAQFILHFGQELVHARLAAVDHHLQTTIPKPENTYVLWATSKKAGRSHADAWELKLKTGEKVKVLQEMGNNWFVVEGRKGTKGWVHGSWLEFSNDRPQQDAKTAYQQFSNEVQKMLVPGQLRVFPSLAGYVDSCTSADCRPVKDDGSLTGFCVHDLETLLRGSECYAQAWLKEQRNVWHPDRFARFCEPAHAGQLKIKAEQLFVLYGVLMQQESAQ